MRRLKHPGILIAYLLLTLGMTYPLVRHLLTSLPGDGFDGWQNYWNLWWVRHALIDLGLNPFFCPLMDFPAGADLIFQTINIFNTWTLPIQLAGGTIAAYNAVVLFSFAASGLGGYLLARYVVRGRSAWPAWIAGLVFAFSPFHFAHLLGHMQVFSMEWLPFYVLYLLKATETASQDVVQTSEVSGTPEVSSAISRQDARGTKSPQLFVLAVRSLRLGERDVLLAALFLALASLCDWYNLLYGLLFTGLYGLYLLARRRLTWSRVGTFAGIGCVGFAVLSPYLGPMIRDASRSNYMMPGARDAYQYSADLLAFVTPNEMHPLWGPPMREWSDRLTTTISERLVFAGYVPLLLAGYALWRSRRAGFHARRAHTGSTGATGDGGGPGNRPHENTTGPGFWALSTLVFAVLALGPALHVAGQLWPAPAGLPLPYRWLVNWVPFMKISRSVSRFDAMVMLALGVGAAFGLAALMERARRWERAPAVLGLVVTVLICFEFLPVPYRMTPPDTPDFYRALAADPQQYAILPVPLDWDRPQYLLYQTVHGKPLTSAYTSRGNPRSWVDWTPLLMHLRRPGPYVIDADPAAVGLSVLQAAGIRYVVVDRYQLPDEDKRAWNVDLISRVFGGQTPTLDDGRLIVYDAWEPRFQALTFQAAAFPRLAEDWSGMWVGTDGETACWLKQRGQIVVHSPAARSATVALRFFNGGDGPVTVRVAGPTGELAARTMGHYGYVDLAIPLDLAAGDVTLTVTADPSVVLPYGFSAVELHRLSVK
jgi:hypothetical protein